ncbi:alkaline phosphatase D family protein [Polaribacter sp. MED152]|uniref:alkaline phosphatase D family protein n=1 Tax=Polaribacter sp. MED152 TaxID=313598 RepID=UPI000186F428|nr:alkaline phosphatase D family protein [Polaribacter sp. MED152]EAQ41320.2 alkaline phosphatase D precursor [Polaribacter sp. MED152]
MRNYFVLIVSSLLFSNCNIKKQNDLAKQTTNHDFTIAFGSCNKQNKTNVLWQEIEKNNPDLWVWGGDIIYSDTENMDKMKNDYETQLNQNGYKSLRTKIPVLATWDDHDYGENDGGTEFPKKNEAQQLFLDFLGVAKTSERRNQEGIHYSKLFKTSKGSINVILLDTRYFRTALTRAKGKRRYMPNKKGEGTILGKSQWSWLEKELNSSTADFNIIVSSIQVLSSEHGFETWGNFPHEVEKLKETIIKSKAKGVLILSGDRHISEFSQTEVPNLPFKLTDFTSSGLTHSYTSYSGEPNKFRKLKVVNEISFGVLNFNFEKNFIDLEMRGRNNKLIQKMKQSY